jgi:hypothetical protein
MLSGSSKKRSHSFKETDMATYNSALRPEHPGLSILLRIAIVLLTLATATIHSTLGGLQFTLNAIGYTAFAGLMTLPGPVAQIRWLVRLALLGFTAATIGGWAHLGARFELAYVDKGIELVLVALLAVEVWLHDGGPAGVARRLGHLLTGFRGLVPGGGRP